MGLLTGVFRPSGSTHGRPPCSLSPSPDGVVPMVPNLITEFAKYLKKHEIIGMDQNFIKRDHHTKYMMKLCVLFWMIP
jgi:hypothetical protein